jgi:hypothetical protein
MQYTKEEILTYNLMIAKFMGAKIVTEYNYFGRKSYLLYYERELSPEMCKHIPCSGLKYHSSMDWQLMVIEKLESMDYYIQILTDTSNKSTICNIGLSNHMVSTNEKVKKEAVYQAVVQIIEQHVKNLKNA